MQLKELLFFEKVRSVIMELFLANYNCKSYTVVLCQLRVTELYKMNGLGDQVSYRKQDDGDESLQETVSLTTT